MTLIRFTRSTMQLTARHEPMPRNSIYQRAELGAELVLPMVFELKTILGRKTHCTSGCNELAGGKRACSSQSLCGEVCHCSLGAIFEFVDGLPDMHVLIPKWVMEDLAIDEKLVM